MLFSDYVAAVKIPDFVANKVKGKSFAQACGFQTAAVYNPPGEFIIKPVRGHSARGVMRTHAGATIVEELLTDAGGFTPLPYLRLDFHHTTKGLRWGEACVTPRFATPRNKKITLSRTRCSVRGWVEAAPLANPLFANSSGVGHDIITR